MAFKSNMLFDVLGNILGTKSIEMYNKHISSERFGDAAKFMILRYLTMSSCAQVRDIVIDNYIDLERMPEKSLYRWLIDNIPQQRNTFIRYIK
jgi:hypothetical protein